mgnify:CR=1 FL=1
MISFVVVVVVACFAAAGVVSLGFAAEPESCHGVGRASQPGALNQDVAAQRKALVCAWCRVREPDRSSTTSTKQRR